MDAMPKTNPCCPSCSSDDLCVIGAFLLSHEGVPYEDKLDLNRLAAKDYSITRELIQCNACGRRSTLEEARRAAGLVVKATYWDSNDKGLKRPIVCPECGNADTFTRDVICAVRSTEYVSIADGELEITESSDAEPQDKVIIRYRCAVTDCTGRIELRTEDYDLVSRG